MHFLHWPLGNSSYNPSKRQPIHSNGHISTAQSGAQNSSTRLEAALALPTCAAQLVLKHLIKGSTSASVMLVPREKDPTFFLCVCLFCLPSIDFQNKTNQILTRRLPCRTSSSAWIQRLDTRRSPDSTERLNQEARSLVRVSETLRSDGMRTRKRGCTWADKLR